MWSAPFAHPHGWYAPIPVQIPSFPLESWPAARSAPAPPEPIIRTATETFGQLLRCRQLNDAELLLQRIMSDGAIGDARKCVYNNQLMTAYSKQNLVDMCTGVLRNMRECGVKPDAVSYNIAIAACGRARRFGDVQQLWEEMCASQLQPNVKTWTSLIDARCKAGNILAACELLRQMVKNDVSPNECTYTALLNGCFKAKDTESANWTMAHARMCDALTDAEKEKLQGIREVFIKKIMLSQDPASQPSGLSCGGQGVWNAITQLGSATKSAPEPVSEKNLVTSCNVATSTDDDWDDICPLSLDRFVDPVVASDGFTYERTTFHAWLATGSQTSPMTGEALESLLVFPNRLARARVSLTFAASTPLPLQLTGTAAANSNTTIRKEVLLPDKGQGPVGMHGGRGGRGGGRGGRGGCRDNQAHGLM